jgi:hypothetical protein
LFRLCLFLSINGAIIISNPLSLNYRFEGNNREAADPVCIYFKGKYYLFASHSSGYWSSEDMAVWNFIPCSSMGGWIEVI